MTRFWDWLTGKSEVECEESEEIDLAIHTLERYNRRRFTVRGPGMKYASVPAEEVIRFIQEELPVYYNYYVGVRTYLDREKVPQAYIEITATIGLRGKSSRYNPLNRRFVVRTEKAKADKASILSRNHKVSVT